MIYTAHAKINLALHVTGQRGDGYHELDTLVVFTEFGDKLEFSENPNGGHLVELSAKGSFGSELPLDESNLIMRAATGLAEQSTSQLRPVHITIEKNLPLASGIGGGSADAAATLKALVDFWKMDISDDKLMALALGLGADVPMCLRNAPLFARGIGEDIALLELHQPLSLVLVNPGMSVSTPEVFSRLTNKSNPAITTIRERKFPSTVELAAMRNDLQIPASQLCPKIASAIALLEGQENCQLARMSGSGATCFGIFPDLNLARQAQARIQAQQPSWWAVAAQTTHYKARGS